MTKVRVRVACRVLAVLLAVWSAFLALDGPTITSSSGTYECSAPISYALSDTVRHYWLDPGEAPDWVYAECRDRRIGAGVAIGFLGTLVAVLLGFTRPPAPPAQPPPPPRPPKPVPPPVVGNEDEDDLWNPGRRLDDLRKPPRADGEPPAQARTAAGVQRRWSALRVAGTPPQVPHLTPSEHRRPGTLSADDIVKG